MNFKLNKNDGEVIKATILYFFLSQNHKKSGIFVEDLTNIICTNEHII